MEDVQDESQGVLIQEMNLVERMGKTHFQLMKTKTGLTAHTN